tara:strand:+ start:15085 stop:15237 length:153 start_codon:yes stop_codon:yes gene_type:complete
MYGNLQLIYEMVKETLKTYLPAGRKALNNYRKYVIMKDQFFKVIVGHAVF